MPKNPKRYFADGCRRPEMRLAAASLMFACIWGWILPAVATLPRVHRVQQWIDEQQLDNSALFYSELPAFEESVARLGSLRRRQPDAWWRRPSPTLEAANPAVPAVGNAETAMGGPGGSGAGKGVPEIRRP